MHTQYCSILDLISAVNAAGLLYVGSTAQTTITALPVRTRNSAFSSAKGERVWTKPLGKRRSGRGKEAEVEGG